MGIAAALVALVYLAIAALLLFAIVPLARALGLVKTNHGVRVALGLTFVLILWPVWALLASHGYFHARCASAAGLFDAKPLSTKALIVNDYGLSNSNGVIDGELHCFDSCSSLTSFFSRPEAAPLLKNNVAVEVRLLGRGGGKFARYWLGPTSNKKCRSVLEIQSKEPMCVAGEVIEGLTAEYEFVEGPLEVCEGSRCIRTTNKHEFLDVQRYENHVLRGTAVVARVVAFERGSAESLFGWQTCPFEKRAYGTWTRHFMDALFPS